MALDDLFDLVHLVSRNDEKAPTIASHGQVFIKRQADARRAQQVAAFAVEVVAAFRLGGLGLVELAKQGFVAREAFGVGIGHQPEPTPWAGAEP